MVGGDRKFVGALTSLLVLGSLALAGCATDASAAVQGEYPDITLAASKSPVQLLRNEAASRIPTGVIETVEETLDESVSCLDESDDPDGTIRSWHSSAVVTIGSDAAWRVESIVDKLIESYTEQEWVARSLGQTADFRSSLLTSKKAKAEIQIIGQRPDKDQVSTSTEEKVDEVTIEIQVHGPCVRTPGAESDEVLKLEGK
jgi:hypothetical protein